MMAEEAFEILSSHVAGAAIDIEVRPMKPEEQPEVEAIWEAVRAFAEGFGAENGGAFTAYQIEAHLPPVLNARLRKIGRPRLSAAMISDKFRRRGWFALGEATCEFKVGETAKPSSRRKRRAEKKAA